MGWVENNPSCLTYQHLVSREEVPPTTQICSRGNGRRGQQDGFRRELKGHSGRDTRSSSGRRQQSKLCPVLFIQEQTHGVRLNAIRPKLQCHRRVDFEEKMWWLK